jgi:hypothetical protein
MIQYSRDIGNIIEKPRRTGYPACAGYDGYLLSAGIYRHCRSIHFSNSAASSHNFAISPHVLREFCRSFRSLKSEGAGNAGRSMRPQPRV